MEHVIALPILLTGGLVLTSTFFWLHRAQKTHVHLLKRLNLEGEHWQKRVKEIERQQLIIYNVTTAIFLLKTAHAIIRGVLEEIHNLYRWPNISFQPAADSGMVPIVLGTGMPTKLPAALQNPTDAVVQEVTVGEEKRYYGIFPVGNRTKPLGIISVALHTNNLTDDQVVFLEAIAACLRVALEHITNEHQPH